MAFNVTDEALDALDQADEPTRLKFFEGLAPDELSAIHAAVPAWRAKKTASQQPMAPADAAPTLADNGPDVSLSVETPVITARKPQPSNFIDTTTRIAKLPAVLSKEIFDTGGRAIDWLGDRAQDVAEEGWQLADKVNQTVGLPTQPAQDLMRRSVVSSVLGEQKSFNNLSDEERLKGINQLEQAVGPTGATAALVGSQALGNALTMINPYSKAKAAVQVAKFAPKTKAIAKAAVQGMAQGYVQGSFQGDDPLTSLIAGGVLGGGLTAAGIGAGELGKAGKFLWNKLKGTSQTLTTEATQQVRKAVEELVSPLSDNPILGQMQLRDALGRAVQPDFVGKIEKADISSPGFKPTSAVIGENANGELVAHIVDYSVGRKPKIAEINVETMEGAHQFKQYADKHRLDFNFALSNPVVAERVGNLPTQHYLELAYPNYARELYEKAPGWTDGPPTKAERIRPTPNLDGPVRGETIEIKVDNNGHMQVEQQSPIPLVAEVTPSSLESTAILGTKRSQAPELGYIKTPDNQSVTVKKFGEDPEVPGNILIRRNENAPLESVPAADYHKALDIAEAQQLNPNLIRVPIEPLQQGFVSPQSEGDYLTLHHTFREVLRRQPKLAERIFGKSGLVSKHLLGPKDLMEQSRALNGVQALEASSNDLLNGLAQAAGGKKALLSAIDKDLNDVALGKQSLDSFAAKHGQLGQKLEALAKPLLAERDALERRIAELGGISDSMLQDKADGLVDKYLARMYMRNVLPAGKWAKLAPAQLLEDAAQSLTDRMQKAGDFWTTAQVRDELLKVLQAQDPMLALQGSTFFKSKAFDALKARKEIPPEIRAVMGELNSGMIRLSQSIANQRAIVAQLELMHGIAQNPQYYSHGPQPHLYHEPVPNNRRLYGDLAGGYVTPEIYERVIQLPQIQRLAPNFMRSLIGFRKGNMVALGGLRPFVRSLVGNWQSSVIAGGLDVLRPIESGKAFSKAVAALSDYSKDPSGKSGFGKVILEMKRFGADWAGLGESELGKDSKYIRELMTRLGKEKGVDAFSFMEKMNHFTFDKYKLMQQKGGALLDFQDRLFRVANYIGLVEKFKSNPGKYLPGIEPSQVDSAAASLAAQRINDSFMNAAHVGEKISNARGNMAGLVAPFLTSMSEEARILGMIPRRMSEDPDLKWRLMSWGLLGAAAFGGNSMLRQSNGISDAEVNAALQNRTDRSNYFRTGLLAAPWRDEKGRIELYDFSQYFLPGQMLQGHPDDALFARVLSNALLAPVDGAGTEQGVRTILEQTGLVRPLNMDRKLIEGEAGLRRTAETLMRLGMTPGVVNQATEVSRKMGMTGARGQFEELMTPRQGAAYLMGAPLVGGANPTSMAGKQEILNEVNKLQSDLNILVKRASVNKIPQAELRKQAEPIMARLKFLRDKMQVKQDATQKYLQEQKK